VAWQVDGDWQFDSRKRLLLWKVDLVDESNKTGSMEFVLPATSPDSFFPVEVSFTANHTLCDVAVTGVHTVSDGTPAKYGCKTLLGVESYQVL
jgi:coatomer subunit delta